MSIRKLNNHDRDDVHRGDLKKIPKAARLRELIRSQELTFILEAHNGLRARIVEEVGFEAIWASRLSISAALGVRDSNGATFVQFKTEPRPNRKLPRPIISPAEVACRFRLWLKASAIGAESDQGTEINE